MKYTKSIGIAAGLALGAAAVAAAGLLADPIKYPQTRKADVVDVLHGVKVPDPFRWLEDPNSEETKRWIEAQNEVAFGYLRAIPERDEIRDRLQRNWNFERFGVPTAKAGKYFYTRNDGLQNQAVLLVADSLHAEPRVLLDPNKLSEDGTVALGSWSIRDDGRYIAYSLSTGGSDWIEWRVRDVETGEDLPDHIRWSKFSGASWSRDGKGFYYSAYDPPAEGEKLSGANFFHKLYFHELGTPQSADRLVYERPDEREWGFAGWETEDGRYLIIHVWQGTHRENRIFYRDLRDPKAETVELLDQADASYDFLGNVGDTFYFSTDKDAPRQRIISVSLDRPEEANWREVVPEREEALSSSSIVGNRLFLTYLKDAHSEVRVYALDGTRERVLDLPGLGSAVGFGGDMKDRQTFYSFVGFTSPSTIYRYDVASGESEVFRRPEFPVDLEQFETRQVFYTSKDGTRVPMFVTHRKGLELDGSNPTLLYGYGGFNSPMTPFFSTRFTTWLDLGGVLAVASIRGGGEYGKEWHDGGRLANKQNTFDDFIAAAEWLIENRYTRPDKLAINGGSNGGLLVGAVLNQRPELFGAAVPEVGVMDMLRFHKFTIGWAWTSDYGSPDDPEMFPILHGYSPYHNVRRGTRYPAVLVLTGDHDDRVVPAHSFKYAAAMQAAQAGEAPVLIRIETSAGHGAGKPTSKIIDETADMFAFLVRNLGMQIRR
jgi:prolyl oligopeptidase